ncbi:MAG: hypothetical protein BGO43_03805 [Gammaproteobacteria bacterium 39-13]|nr:hypothetical protein [Gammaproteobacteria bacterium]OJV96519.1 MAG: hypothetical protein BGO43_03805 [Gammaproteobacteria bacterium 39-13]
MLFAFFPLQHSIEQNKFFQEFIQRCRSARMQGLPTALEKLVTKQDIHTIFDLIEKNLYSKIALMSQGSSLRFAKKDTGLARTFNVLRLPSGEYALVVETKSKLADHTSYSSHKQTLPIRAGTIKSGKPAWRIDGWFSEYFNLTCTFRNSAELESLMDEYKISMLINSPFVNKYMLGDRYTNNKGQPTISLYAPKALFNLKEFLSLYPQISCEQKDIFISDLLYGIKAFQEKGYVHQDIKLENLLVYYYNGFYRLKLNDFGLSSRYGDTSILPVGSPMQSSPEILYLNSVSSAFYFAMYQTPNVKNGLAYWVMSKNRSLYPARNSIKRKEFDTPHFANDMWSAGIAIFYLLYGQAATPKDWQFIQYNPLLKGLLHPERHQRVKIDEAIALHQSQTIENRKVEAMLALPFNQFIRDPEISALFETVSMPRPTYLPQQNAIRKSPSKTSFTASHTLHFDKTRTKGPW